MRYNFTFTDGGPRVVTEQCQPVPNSRVLTVKFPADAVAGLEGTTWHITGQPTADIEVAGQRHDDVPYRQC